MYWLDLIALTSVIVCVSSHTYFMERIPNGDRVPHPCGGEETWGGVGHHYPGGARGTGGIRNRFGIDFKRAGLVWTQELCRKDSDMDGWTNGEELGDPNCNWKPGDFPEKEARSHPGICEPTDSVTCQEHNERFGDRLECKQMPKPCPALTEPANSNASNLEGQQVLDCQLQYPQGTPVNYIVQWNKDGLDAPVFAGFYSFPPNIHTQYEGRMRLVNEISLEISPIQKSDEGWYECKVTYIDGVEHNKSNGTRIYLNVNRMKSKDFRFPQTPVPAIDTFYTCMAYDLPLDGDFHLASTTPIINNTNIVHHMILFGCDFPENFNKTVLYRMKAAPYPCGMTPHKHCNHFVGTWTYGHQGDCWSKEAGFRIGRYGTKVAALQIHWNNPRKLRNQTDSSGMTIHYTTRRRRHDASMFIVGQEYLRIPPHSNGVTFSATCPSECTSEMFQEKIYITRAANHMHHHGKKQRISIYRNGTKIRDLTDDDNYNYDHPIFYHFDPPVEVLPGDDIVTECTYNSDKHQTIKFGAGTNDEMCYGFLTYYPKQSFLQTLCIQWKSIQRCVRKLPKFRGIYDGCEWRSFTEGPNKGVMIQGFSDDVCGYYHHHKMCNSNCTDFSQKILQHPCLQGDLGDFIGMRTKMPVDVLRTCAESSANRNTCGLVVMASLVIYVSNLHYMCS